MMPHRVPKNSRNMMKEYVFDQYQLADALGSEIHKHRSFIGVMDKYA